MKSLLHPNNMWAWLFRSMLEAMSVSGHLVTGRRQLDRESSHPSDPSYAIHIYSIICMICYLYTCLSLMRRSKMWA